MNLRATLDGCVLKLFVDKDSLSVGKSYPSTDKGKFVAIYCNESISIFSELELLQITGKETYEEALSVFKDCLYTELEI